MCESGGMAQTVNVIVPAEDRERLLAIISDRNRPLKHVQRRRSFCRLPSGCRSLKWRDKPGSAAPQCGAGNSDTASKASMGS